MKEISLTVCLEILDYYFQKSLIAAYDILIDMKKFKITKIQIVSSIENGLF